LLYHSLARAAGPLLDTLESCFYLNSNFRQNCGEYPRADHFYATRAGGAWIGTAPAPLQLEAPWPIGGLHKIKSGGRTISYFMSGTDDGIDNLGYAIVNSNGSIHTSPRLLPSSMSEDGYQDADPWVSDDNKLMFFWSNRPYANSTDYKQKNIWYSTNPDGWSDPANWSAPQIIDSQKINSEKDDMQAFYHDGYLYFSSGRDPVFGIIAIYRSSLTLSPSADLSDLSDSAFGTPELVIYSDFAVGEQTITGDGEYLYFEQIFWDGDTGYNADIMYVEKVN